MTLLEKFQNNRNALGWAFMLPAAVLLLLFLTYPLGLGTWLGFTDAKIGRSGEWIGLENFSFLMGDSVTRLALFNTVFYTVVASILKFVLGLWLALLLNRNLPFKSFFRAVVLLPWIVPTVMTRSVCWMACTELSQASDGRASPNHTTLGRISPPHVQCGGSTASTGSAMAGSGPVYGLRQLSQ